jgi:hypothetical protein
VAAAAAVDPVVVADGFCFDCWFKDDATIIRILGLLRSSSAGCVGVGDADHAVVAAVARHGRDNRDKRVVSDGTNALTVPPPIASQSNATTVAAAQTGRLLRRTTTTPWETATVIAISVTTTNPIQLCWISLIHFTGLKVTSSSSVIVEVEDAISGWYSTARAATTSVEDTSPPLERILLQLGATREETRRAATRSLAVVYIGVARCAGVNPLKETLEGLVKNKLKMASNNGGDGNIMSNNPPLFQISDPVSA